MKARVQKWGNSLAVRIPRSFANEVGFAQDSAVELSLEKGRLCVKPAAKPWPTLRQLLAKVTPENRHGEVNTGPAKGNEAW